MADKLSQVDKAIIDCTLPDAFPSLFGDIWDAQSARFNAQESRVLDFKETIPREFSDSYGSGIVRSAPAFYNTFGGAIIFGVEDENLSVTGTDLVFDIEKLNWLLSDVADVRIECLTKTYTISTNGSDKSVCVVLVPKRRLDLPARLKSDFGKYKRGTLWILGSDMKFWKS